jgi:hypothetical protein
MWQSGYTSCHWVAAVCRWPHKDKTAIQRLPACRISAELRGCSLRGTVGAGWQWVLAASIGHASNLAYTLLLTIYLRVLANPQLMGRLSLDFFSWAYLSEPAATAASPGTFRHLVPRPQRVLTPLRHSPAPSCLQGETPATRAVRCGAAREALAVVSARSAGALAWLALLTASSTPLQSPSGHFVLLDP